MDDFNHCLNEGRLGKIAVQRDLIEKEVREAQLDFQCTKNSLGEGNAKWAIVQACYSMFHSAKALVLSKGYREKSHTCLSIAVKVLFVEKKST